MVSAEKAPTASSPSPTGPMSRQLVGEEAADEADPARVVRQRAGLQRGVRHGLPGLVADAEGERHREREAGEEDRDAAAEAAVEVAEEGDGPEERDERDGGGAGAEERAQPRTRGRRRPGR